MGRGRKKKKKNSQRNAASKKVQTPASPAQKNTEANVKPEPATVAATPATVATTPVAAAASANAPVTPVAPDAPWETWPPLQDRGQNPVRLPYDHGGIPLLLLLFYMTFLGFSMTYMANWLAPDFLNYFFTE
ncbi:MAG: hypothetical protein P1V97_21115 [Planctomycetota bacterium]|nr:hypothetical protein [Planctomycetota bacterium]